MAKQETVLGVDPKDADKDIVQRIVKDKETEKTAEYSRYRGRPQFAARVRALEDAINGNTASEADKEEAEWYFSAYAYYLSVSESQKVRDAAISDNTTIKVNKQDLDLMDLPVPDFVMAFNGSLAANAILGAKNQGAFVAAKRKRLENGTVRLTDASKPDGAIAVV